MISRWGARLGSESCSPRPVPPPTSFDSPDPPGEYVTTVETSPWAFVPNYLLFQWTSEGSALTWVVPPGDGGTAALASGVAPVGHSGGRLFEGVLGLARSFRAASSFVYMSIAHCLVSCSLPQLCWSGAVPVVLKWSRYFRLGKLINSLITLFSFPNLA